MKAEQIDRYRKQLRALADRVGRTAAGLEEQVRTATGGEPSGGLSNVPLHLGDIGSEAYNQELGATLLENEAYIRDEAHAALDRLERGTYGRCEHCGHAIPLARLDALPYVRHCTPCATELQSGVAVNLNTGRPASWLGEPGHEGAQTGSPHRVVGHDLGGEPDDVHAAGTPGGGSAVGGLAGTNVGSGAPDEANLEQAMGSGNFDNGLEADEGEDSPEAFAGPSGGAVGGTPANKRARGGRSAKSGGEKPPKSKPAKKPRGKRPKE